MRLKRIENNSTEKVTEVKKQTTLFFRVILISWIFIKLRGLVFNKIFSNYLTQDEFGQFNFLFQTATFMGGISILGIDNAIIRFTSLYKEQKTQKRIANLLITSLLITFTIYVIIYSLYLLLSFADFATFGEYNLVIVVFLGLLGLFLLIYNVLNCYIQADRRSKGYILLNVVTVYTNLFLGLIFALIFGGRVFELILSYTISYGLLVILYLIKFFMDNGFGTFSITEFKRIVKFSTPGFVLTPILRFFEFFVYFLLNAFSGEAMIALFVIANSLAGFLNIPVNSASMSFRSLQFSLFDSNEHARLKILINKILKIYISLLIPIVLLIWFNSRMLIEILSNKTFINPETILATLILGTGFIFKVFLHVTCQAPYFYEETRKIAERYFIAVIIAILLSIFLIPPFGLIGMALAMTFHDFLRWIFVFPLSQSLFKVQYSITKIISIVIPTLFSVLLFQWLINFNNTSIYVLIFSAFCLVIYFIGLFILKILNYNELKMIIRSMVKV